MQSGLGFRAFMWDTYSPASMELQVGPRPQPQNPKTLEQSPCSQAAKRQEDGSASANFAVSFGGDCCVDRKVWGDDTKVLFA